MVIKDGNGGYPLVTTLTLEEEMHYNDPTTSLKGVMDMYRNSYNEKLGHGLYEWAEFQFANTHLIQGAANHFRKYEQYCDIDREKDRYAWDSWWDREEYRRINGITLPLRVPEGGALSDKDLLPVWIPGNMYGQLNYGPIKRVKDKELELAQHELGFTKADGVESLFEGLAHRETREKGVDFPDFWDGHYHTYIAMYVARKLGTNIAILKARRKGFSYIGAWDAFNTADMYPNTTVILAAYDLKYLNKGRGLFKMVKEYSDHINLHTEWRKRRSKDTQTELEFGFRYRNNRAIAGYRSEVVAVSAANNPDVVRGKDPNSIFWEECGTFPNLSEAIEATEAALEAGGYSTGNSQYWGTVGSAEADYHALSLLFYSPLGYNCLPFRNIYDKNARDTACSMFFSMYQNLEGTMDKHGNSDRIAAHRLFEKQKEIKKKHARKVDYDKWLAERATTPKDALSRTGRNLFSDYHDDILEQIHRIEHDTDIKKIFRYGTYQDIGGNAIFVSNEQLIEQGKRAYQPIDDMWQFLPKDVDPHGCVVEWETPFTIKTPGAQGGVDERIPNGLYYAWHDPYATDKFADDITQEDSLGVTYIYEATNNYTPSRGDRIVASWVGRPPTTDQYNHVLFLMLRRWNAQMMFENDRGEVIPYAKRYGLMDYLMDEPEMLSLKEYGIEGKTGRNKGMSIGKHPLRKATGALFFKDHLGNQISVAPDGTPKTFVSYIYCKLLLRQCLNWSKDGNFDAVSAAIVGMYQVKETLDIHAASTRRETNTSVTQADFWSQDFF